MAASLSFSAGVGLEQDDGGARLGQRPLDAGVRFLGERRIERRQRVRVARLEHRLRGLVALGRIGGEQGQATERRLDRAAQPIVEPHRAEIGGRIRRGLAGRGIEDRAGLVADEDLVAARRARRPSCSAWITSMASGLPLAATAPIALSVSLKLSLVKPASAAS